MALALPWGSPLTVDDLERLPDDGHRYELLDGMLLVTPAPALDHQRCIAGLVAALLAAAGDDHDVIPAPFDWLVGPRTLFQPDLLVARTDEVGPARLERAPLLAVEVQSPSTRLYDLNLKRAAYEAAGVAAYWLVDPAAPVSPFCTWKTAATWRWLPSQARSRTKRRSRSRSPSCRTT